MVGISFGTHVPSIPREDMVRRWFLCGRCGGTGIKRTYKTPIPIIPLILTIELHTNVMCRKCRGDGYVPHPDAEVC